MTEIKVLFEKYCCIYYIETCGIGRKSNISVYSMLLHRKHGRIKPLCQVGPSKKFWPPPLLGGTPLKIEQKAVNFYFLFVQKIYVYKSQFSCTFYL